MELYIVYTERIRSTCRPNCNSQQFILNIQTVLSQVKFDLRNDLFLSISSAVLKWFICCLKYLIKLCLSSKHVVCSMLILIFFFFYTHCFNSALLKFIMLMFIITQCLIIHIEQLKAGR